MGGGSCERRSGTRATGIKIARTHLVCDPAASHSQLHDVANGQQDGSSTALVAWDAARRRLAPSASLLLSSPLSSHGVCVARRSDADVIIAYDRMVGHGLLTPHTEPAS